MEEKKKNIVTLLAEIQAELKAPKDQKAKNYAYRSLEDINEAIKPLANSRGCAIYYTNKTELIECAASSTTTKETECVERKGKSILMCVAECTLSNGDEWISANAECIINTVPQFMSIEQSCGSASTYARKLAVSGLFSLDNSENDPDKREGK
jgi:ERF superfamily